MNKINHEARYVDEALGVNRKVLAEKLKAIEEKASNLPKDERHRISKFIEIMDNELTKRELLFMVHIDIFRPGAEELLARLSMADRAYV